ncbi:shikimate dehydrogenase family protein [Bauldia sp.]|uniref:shikimate dehydrogenase family protein n=1 Tax=Bauldia sp. TaxID=2575872 RepID=UPI003BADAC2C
MTTFVPAERRTLYFIGVSTAKSSIMKVFPRWAEHLNISDAAIKGMDFVVHDDPEAYRRAVAFIRSDPLSLGALVTTHKIDLFEACHDLFDEIGSHARLMGETSCLSKRDGRLICHAKDPIASRLSLEAFVPQGHFARTGADVFCMGAGGSAIAITWNLMRKENGDNVPARIIVSNRSPDRLDRLRTIHTEIDSAVPVSYVLAEKAGDNDAVLADLKPGSLVINATGLGKDAPGSPLGDAAQFPERALAWDLNYRGDLVFLDQARRQQQTRGIHVEDGWVYFLHGWTQVIAEVFDIAIPATGPGFDALSEIAAATRRPAS